MKQAQPEALESPRERRFDLNRTVALSDGVFSIAMTLLVLSISVPHLVGADDELGRALRDRWPEFRSYAISFAVISLFWTRHHSFFRELREVDGRITALNLVYLGLIAFVPYPTELLGLYGSEFLAVALYALTLAVIGVLAILIRLHALRAGLLTTAGERFARRENSMPGVVLVPAIFLASVGVAAVDPHAAPYVWILIAFVRPGLGRGGAR
jgi:uncharacterized membrane protein